MCNHIQHRGPDGQQTRIIRGNHLDVHLGHTLLQVIDPSDENRQPMATEDHRYHLIFNGEIANYRQLRQQLIREGTHFRTNGDTEVLLQWLIHYGKAGLSELGGMFAFAFLDQQQQTLLCARDRFGIKPLYVARAGDRWLYCSEIKGLLASQLLPKEFHAEQLPYYLGYRHSQVGHTLFRGIDQVLPGQWREHSPLGMQLGSFRQPQSARQQPIQPDGIQALLQASVEQQLHADVPVGLFLSGGVDSTLLLALSHKLGRKLPAFVAAHPPGAGSFGTEDQAYARRAARQFGAELQEVPIDATIFSRLDEYVQQLDQPIADSGGLLSYCLSEAARRQVTVVLSGAGADELFGGYNRHLAFARYLRHQRLLTVLRPALRAAASLLPDGVDHPWRKEARLMKKFARNLRATPAATYQQFCRMRLIEGNSPSLWPTNLKGSPLDLALIQDRQQYLVGDVLTMSDQASMAHGLELRVPYLSNALLQAVEQAGAAAVLAQGRKWLLRTSLSQLGGAAYGQRGKEGFGLPMGPWLRSPAAGDWLAPVQEAQHPLYEWLDHRAIQSLIQSHLRQREDYSAEITAIIILFRWWAHTFEA